MSKIFLDLRLFAALDFQTLHLLGSLVSSLGLFALGFLRSAILR